MWLKFHFIHSSLAKLTRIRYSAKYALAENNFKFTTPIRLVPDNYTYFDTYKAIVLLFYFVFTFIIVSVSIHYCSRSFLMPFWRVKHILGKDFCNCHCQEISLSGSCLALGRETSFVVTFCHCARVTEIRNILSFPCTFRVNHPNRKIK